MKYGYLSLEENVKRGTHVAYLLDLRENHLVLTINRPEIHNAINDEVMQGFKEALQMIKDNQNIGYFVITGAGEKSFCSGGDLSVFHALRTEQEASAMLHQMGGILYEVATLPIPTIALMNGTAVGGGCEIASACDYRIMNEEAKAGFIQGTLAITCGWGGGTYLMQRGLRHDHTMKLLMDAKPLVAKELAEIGFTSSLYTGDKWAALAEFTERFQFIHPNVLRSYKELMRRDWENRNVKALVLQEIDQCARLWEAEEHHDAVQSFLKKKQR